MLELTLSFDALLEANRVSSEDTQAQLDEFRSDAMDQARLQGSNLRYWGDDSRARSGQPHPKPSG